MLKELAEDEYFGAVKTQPAVTSKIGSRTTGDHVRRILTKSLSKLPDAHSDFSIAIYAEPLGDSAAYSP